MYTPETVCSCIYVMCCNSVPTHVTSTASWHVLGSVELVRRCAVTTPSPRAQRHAKVRRSLQRCKCNGALVQTFAWTCTLRLCSAHVATVISQPCAPCAGCFGGDVRQAKQSHALPPNLVQFNTIYSMPRAEIMLWGNNNTFNQATS
jgi:hypothetical protein